MLEYTHTNEDLRAIVHGLDLSLDDKVLAICGSGDQAFAMLEKAGEVVAVDYNQSQLKYALERLKHLKKGDHTRFLVPDPDEYFDLRNSRRYFNWEKFQKIKSRIDSLKIITDQINIFDSGLAMVDFTKIYLSNALDYGYGPIRKDRERLGSFNLEHFVEPLREGTLIYDTNLHHRFEVLCKNGCLEKEEELTRIARWLEEGYHWNPTVYKKIK